jgi:Fur family zinc uptake transcriptional regulator
MSKHHHHEHAGQSLAQAAQNTLERSGERWTDMRGAIFSALASHARPASAYDIADQVSSARGKRVAPNSVYRILDLFVGNNLALRVESANAYLANPHPGCQHDCIFLVCDGCGSATHLDDDALTQKVRTIANDNAFRPDRPIIEVRGLCNECQLARAR